MTPTSPPNEQRHAPLNSIEQYLEQQTVGAIAVPGSPSVHIVVLVNPNQAIGLRVLGTGREPDLSKFEYLKFRSLVDDGQSWQEFAITVNRNTEVVYALLCNIADRVQIDQETFGDAIETALKSFDALLAQRSSLSLEQQLGLFGELLTLQGLGAAQGVAALDRWRGPQGEEHDFALDQVDFEVKTTRSERREHQISGVNQLEATAGRDLYVLSIQLTDATTPSGNTLPELVSELRNQFSARSDLFDGLLMRSNYRNADADLYRARWMLRSNPVFFRIDDQFPAITQTRLNLVVPSAQRIRDLRYRIDLTNLDPADPLFPLGPT
jgi:hypothetical protein